MADTITIGTTTIDANEIEVNITASVEVESNPWLLRSSALASRSSAGYKSIEVETLSGKRVLVQGKGGTYVSVPINNDAVVLTMDKVYSCIIVSVNAIGADATSLDTLATDYKASMKYYASRYLIRAQLNNESISYTKKVSLLADYNAVTHSGLAVSAPGISGSDWEYAESGGLSVSYWSNGPYADIKLSVVSRTLITL
jgi:hypothetical protein